MVSMGSISSLVFYIEEKFYRPVCCGYYFEYI